MKKIALFSALLSVFFSGCAALSDYRLGTTLDPGLRDVYIPTIYNETGEPGVVTALSGALRKEIQRDGTLRIVPESEATTKLEIVVREYVQEASSYSRTDTQRPNEYRMTLRASVVFSKIPRNQAGEAEPTVIWAKTVAGSETFAGGSDTVSAKLSCLPRAAEDLAEAIVDGCVGAW